MDFASQGRKQALRQELAASLAQRRAWEEALLAGAVGLLALGAWLALVTLPTAVFGDLGGGYQAFMALSSIGLGVAMTVLARLWLRRQPLARTE